MVKWHSTRTNAVHVFNTGDEKNHIGKLDLHIGQPMEDWDTGLSSSITAQRLCNHMYTCITKKIALLISYISSYRYSCMRTMGLRPHGGCSIGQTEECGYWVRHVLLDPSRDAPASDTIVQSTLEVYKHLPPQTHCLYELTLFLCTTVSSLTPSSCHMWMKSHLQPQTPRRNIEKRRHL